MENSDANKTSTPLDVTTRLLSRYGPTGATPSPVSYLLLRLHCPSGTGRRVYDAGQNCRRTSARQIDGRWCGTGVGDRDPGLALSRWHHTSDLVLSGRLDRS